MSRSILVTAVIAGAALVAPTPAAGASDTSGCNDHTEACYRLTNRPPVAGDDTYSSPKNVTYVVYADAGVLGNDTDPDSDTLSAALITRPDHGTLALRRNGSFTYKPAPGYEGPDRFTYQASDGIDASPVATVNLKLGSFNEAPWAKPDEYEREILSQLSVPPPGVLANDTDDGGATLVAHAVGGPAHGTLTLDPDGSFIYQPRLLGPPSGTDTFTYRLYDGNRFSMPTTVTITIRPPVHAPPAADPPPD